MLDEAVRSLQGRTAVVTGAASGIGLAVALALAKSGATVVVGDYDPLPESTELFQQHGIVQRRCDVRSESEVRALIHCAAERTGKLEILVNNAGIKMVKPITDVTEQEWDDCLNTNLKGAFLTCKHAIPWMRKGGGGSIINVASNAGLLPRAHDPVYSISKGALVALTKSLALCHSVDRIRVNAVCPGPVRNTRMMNSDLEDPDTAGIVAQQIIDASPLARAFGRMIDPEEVAEAVLYLASDAAAMVTGTAIAIDGGKSLGVPPRGPCG
jgi:NAD(P)-dependent dehydrogenase (short-subunit alcohol dehydrogenase family)